jgi:hypothetical protein
MCSSPKVEAAIRALVTHCCWATATRFVVVTAADKK